MSDQNVKYEIAQRFLVGLRSRDWNALKDLMTEDVFWTLPGDSLISGEAHGVDAVIKRAQTIVSYGLTFTLKHVLYGQHGVALSLNNTAQREGAILDEHLATVFELRDGKISGINTYLSDVDMVNRFFV
jgi:ketosteroid isomerase-like protein